MLIWNQKEERNLAFTQILHLHLNKWSSPVCLSGFLWLHLSFLFSKTLVLSYTQALGDIFGEFSSARCTVHALIWACPWGSATMKWTCLGTRCQDWGMTQRGVRDTWSAWRASGKLLPPFPRSEKTAADQHLTAIYHTGSTQAINQPTPPGWKQWAIPHLFWHRCSVYFHMSLTSVLIGFRLWLILKTLEIIWCTVLSCWRFW